MEKDLYAKSDLTIRDYFAAKAMQTILSYEDDMTMDDIATLAYEMADAMMRQRKKEIKDV